jgi:hypothetical protein
MVRRDRSRRDRALRRVTAPRAACCVQDHFEEGPEREALYRNVHRPLKLWYNANGLASSHGPFPSFWQVRTVFMCATRIAFVFVLRRAPLARG